MPYDAALHRAGLLVLPRRAWGGWARPSLSGMDWRQGKWFCPTEFRPRRGDWRSGDSDHARRILRSHSMTWGRWQCILASSIVTPVSHPHHHPHHETAKHLSKMTRSFKIMPIKFFRRCFAKAIIISNIRSCQLAKGQSEQISFFWHLVFENGLREFFWTVVVV